MIRIISIGLTMLFIILSSGRIHAQNEVVITEIVITGNEHTRLFVLHREMDIKKGDTVALADFQQTLLRNENHLINTGLFVSAKVSAPEWRTTDKTAVVHVEVNETWYLFPLPVLKLADRNFNVWWEDFNHDFDRLIWGVRMHHFNLTGVRDYLKVIAEFGFSQRYQIRYRYPYLNKSKTLGLELEASFRRSRNGAYVTRNNQLEFLISEEKDNFRSLFGKISTKYRPKFYLTHETGISFSSNAISDIVRDLNPDYHYGSNAEQRYFSIFYRFKNDRRDRTFQATAGYSFDAYITQVGFGIFDNVDYGFVHSQLKKYLSVNQELTIRLAPAGRWFFNKNRIPYNHSQGLGYGNSYVRGYEHYVVDGTDFILSHQGLVWQFYDRTLNLEKLLPLKKMNVVPIRLYLAANVDWAYVNAPAEFEVNTLANQWLYGYGPSLEILLAEGYLFGIDFSINHLGESGLFLHTKFNF